MKKCKKCGCYFPETREYFYVSKGYLLSECKKCVAKRGKLYRKNNKKAIAEYKDQYRTDNIESIKKYHKQYYQNNRESFIEKRKQYVISNVDKIKMWHKQYREDNKEFIAEGKKRWYKNNHDHIERYRQKHRERIIENKRKYRQSHLRERCIYQQAREAKKRLLPHTLTVEQWETIKSGFGYRCAYCGKQNSLTQEHFIPLSKGGEYTHNNIIPACASCNHSKKDNLFNEWYPKFRHYSKKRERAILNYLNYHNGVQQLTLM